MHKQITMCKLLSSGPLHFYILLFSTNTKSAITWYKNNQMQANVTTWHYIHTSKDTDTYLQCEGINIKPEDVVKMLGINIDKKTEIRLSCYRSNQKMCIPTECFKAKIQNFKY